MSQKSRIPRKIKKDIKNQILRINTILYLAETNPEFADNLAPILPGLRQTQAEYYVILENKSLKNVLQDLDIEVQE